MKNFKKIMLITVTMFFVAMMVQSFTVLQTTKPWDVPAKSKNEANPVNSDAASIKNGGDLYKKNCLSCHGKTGLGDGTKAAQLETFPGDFTSAAFQKQTDGELFYKSKTGRDEMPSFKGKIDDEDIWNLVNYMRTFKK
jgi:mono/diheme cytochrome c family protein